MHDECKFFDGEIFCLGAHPEIAPGTFRPKSVGQASSLSDERASANVTP
jgi:hypothetical protein